MAHCIAAFQQPYANLLDSSGAPQKYDLPSPRSRPSSNRLLRLFRDLRLDRELYDIIFNIAVFTGDLGHWFEDRKCPFDPLELQKHACLLMYALFNWYAEGGKERTPLDQSVCLGLLIFVVKASHPYDPSYRAIILTTVKKLRAALTTTSIFRWAKSPDLLLWTLTMGAVAAQGSSEVAFFSQYCSVAFADAGCDETTAEELLERMKKCLWIPNVFDEEVKRLWTQMGLVKGEEEDQNEMPNGQEGGLISPEINEDDIVGMLTSARFFPNKK
ncbi:hypothetical protein CC78DRAFT_534629 [Lojkania enalia]|uniref:Uncharacterized protein n=1 Tax=Lojkania enalia TaxID=147567 RepID=A0A9P4N7P4_9PLEO|nr:hypothetical protein CC78DRAFT_534629 [Didymosphaeria enalia]